MKLNSALTALAGLVGMVSAIPQGCKISAAGSFELTSIPAGVSHITKVCSHTCQFLPLKLR